MKKEVIVLSLGGSVILASKGEEVLLKLQRLLKKHYRTYKFVIVCGGGSVARIYQQALQRQHRSSREVARAGIRATRMNAQFVMQIFGKEANDTLPHTIHEVAAHLPKNKVVICGSLRFAPDETSDSTAAKLADHLKARFINMTNVPGLYTADPRTHPKAQLIEHEDWTSFEKRARKIHYKPGQHFVLDQKAATRIRQKKIPTYIVNTDLPNLDRLLTGKSFKGTTIGPA